MFIIACGIVGTIIVHSDHS